MKKRWMAMLLLAAIVLTLLPITPARAIEFSESDNEDVIRQRVTQLVDAYAASVYQPGSSVEAFFDFGFFATLHGESEMTVQKTDAIVSTVFNAELMQAYLIESLTHGIVAMQDLNMAEGFIFGSPSWHEFYYTNSASLYKGNYPGFGGEGYDSTYYQRNNDRIAVLVSASSGTQIRPYEGPVNNNDKILQLLAGSLGVAVDIKRVEVTADEAVYDLKVTFEDVFNFDSNYQAAAKKGYDTRVDEVLRLVGKLLSKVFLNNYHWGFSDTLQLRVPYTCDHQTGAHRWEYSKENGQMVSVTDDGYIANYAERMEYTDAKTGKVTPYFKLDDTVVLEHDAPWVVEFEGKKLSSTVLSPLHTNSVKQYSSIYQYSYYYSWIYDMDSWIIPQKDAPNLSAKDRSQYIYYYTGARLSKLFKYSSKYTYTYRLENRVAEDGSNMIWVSVYNNDLDRVEVEPIPMDDLWTLSKGEKTRTLQSENSDHIVGKDFIINYIGNKSVRINHETLKLTIWENGESTKNRDTFTTRYQAPTCTKDGGNIHECSHCGYSYVTELEPATGHTYGAYVNNHDAGCEHDGTETATCVTCGNKDTRVLPGTALGHVPEVLESVEPHCDVSGLGEGSYCTRCRKILQIQPIIPAPGHVWQAATCLNLKTCTVCGYQEGRLADHRPVTVAGEEATCAQPGWTEGIACGDCGKILKARESIAPTWEHDYRAADCESAQHCAQCGATTGNALGHSLEVVAGYPATCAEPGLSDGEVCTVCGKVVTEQQILEAVGHNWLLSEDGQSQTCAVCGESELVNHEHVAVTVPAVEATCTEPGMTEGSVCGDCGQILVPQAQTSATGHSWQAATCEKPETCADCGATQGEPGEHTAQTVLGTAATCLQEGLTDGAVCADCAAVLTEQQTIPATGHNWQAATCEKPETCAVCGATQGEAKGHEWVEKAAVNPTCGTSGLTRGVSCAVCGAVGTEPQTIPSTGEHVDRNENGSCDVCDAVLEAAEVEEIAEEDEDAAAEEVVEDDVEEATEEVVEEVTEEAAEDVDVSAESNMILMAPAPNQENAEEQVTDAPAEAPAEDSAVTTGSVQAAEPKGNVLPVVLIVGLAILVIVAGVVIVKTRKK